MLKLGLTARSTALSKAPQYQEQSGNYFASVLVETIVQPLPKTNSNIGIDLGVTDFIVMSDETRVAHPKFLAKHENKLAREQKVLARRGRRLKLKQALS